MQVGDRPEQAKAVKHERAAPYLDELIQRLLPDVETVVLLGKHAQAAWRNYRPSRPITVLSCPHPGPQSWNNLDPTTGKKRGELVVESLRLAAR
jgi:uracil-DNA glycosylase